MNKAEKTNRSQYKSIQKKFSLGLIWVVTLILILFSIAVVVFNVKFLENELQDQLTDVSDLAGLSLPNALWQYNYEYINDFANSVSLYKDIVFIRISTKDQIVNTKVHLDLLNKEFSYFKKSSNFIINETKIIHNKFDIGFVQIAMTRERIKRSIINNSAMAIFLIFIIIIAIITTNLFLSRKYLFKPLAELEHSTKLIAEGDFDAGIDTSSKDEIGKLARSFRHMITNIKSITASRDSLNYEINERKIAQKKIKTALKEKEVRLREIHHRVKNNMQVIISLLSLQAEKIDVEKFSDMFKESQSRIKAMSLVHERLYKSSDLANIDFGEYIRSFVGTLAASHGIGQGRISINTKVENTSFDLDNAIPCGLIINELVSNALKYAFPENRNGEIQIIVNSIKNKEIELIVKDDGIGLSKDFNFDSIATLGLDLTKTIVKHQLGGTIKIDRTNGTTFHILFERQKYKARI